jgi:4-hydroxybenzoate polyprenyltransferase
MIVAAIVLGAVSVVLFISSLVMAYGYKPRMRKM